MVDDRGKSQVETAPVQFGIFDWIDRNQLALPDLYEQRLQWLEYADEAGFYCYHLAEHQGTPLGMAPSPSVFLSAAIQHTRRIRLGPLVYLLPLYNPLRLVQEICMLDNLSRGRLEVGVGRGVSPYELAFFNVTPPQSRAMFREALDILTAGLTSGEVSYAGEYYSFQRVPLHIEPFQRPYPPLWYPTDNANSITWLAQEGLNTVTHYLPMATMRQLFDLYKQVWQEHHTNPKRLNAHVADPKYGIVRHVYVADTDAQALQEAKAAFADFISNFNYLRTVNGDTSGRAAYLADFEARLAEGLHIVGSPETVKTQVQEHIRITGSNYFVGSFFFGTLTGEQTLRSLRLFAEEVMPAFRHLA
ncbi:MAG TPA: LLM class flavin-dependent oxidoreductase [Candidatus Tectomicrobia bacterium]|nr:LLM class flavin-dependent oxidoreductase [Candidatus Tectomicrobia bacterium]